MWIFGDMYHYHPQILEISDNYLDIFLYVDILVMCLDILGKWEL